MKIGISYWMLEGGLEARTPIHPAMQQARDLGYDSIELAVASEGVLTDGMTRAQCEDIRADADRIGIEISSLASGESWTQSPTANNLEVRRRILDFTHRSLQVAQWLHTDSYLFVPGAVDVFFRPDAEVVPYDVCYQRATEAIRDILPIAEKTGVTICIENVWNKFLLSPLEMRDFIDGFSPEWVGAYFDVGNVLLTGYPDQWIRILGKRIKRIHVKDFRRSVGTVEGFVDLLQGDVDFEAVKQALGDVGYDGYITAEVLPYESGRPARTAEVMKHLFK